jgi:hypothetical protein
VVYDDGCGGSIPAVDPSLFGSRILLPGVVLKPLSRFRLGRAAQECTGHESKNGRALVDMQSEFGCLSLGYFHPGFCLNQ